MPANQYLIEIINSGKHLKKCEHLSHIFYIFTINRLIFFVIPQVGLEHLDNNKSRRNPIEGWVCYVDL